MNDIVLRPMGYITTLSSMDEKLYISRSRIQTESEAAAHRAYLDKFVSTWKPAHEWKPVTTAIYRERDITALQDEIARLRAALVEERKRALEEAATLLAEKASGYDAEARDVRNAVGEKRLSAVFAARLRGYAAAIRSLMEKPE